MTKPRVASDTGLATKADFFHEVIDAWLGDGDIAILCGNWSDGVVSKIEPGLGAHLTPGRREHSLTGVRALRTQAGVALAQLDLGRVHQVCYAIAPSVESPSGLSLQIRFLITGPGGALTDRWLLAIEPGVCVRVGLEQVRHFLTRACDHWKRAPDCVGFDIGADVRESEAGGCLLAMFAAALDRPVRHWADVLGVLSSGDGIDQPYASTPPVCLPVLAQALRLRDASLVICRDRTVVEVPTDKLAGIQSCQSTHLPGWCIGDVSEPHCHLALEAVTRVLFSAESSVSGVTEETYAVWFLTEDACGNPLRRNGYFSVRLNRTSSGDATQRKHIEALFDVYRSVMREPWVDADSAFLRAMRHGASTREGRSGKPFARRVKKG
jgi:hypothetical protein